MLAEPVSNIFVIVMSHCGQHIDKRATDLSPSNTAKDTTSPSQIGAALAREFIQAQWLRIHIGVDAEMSTNEMDNWCPVPRLRFRLPPWWLTHDLIIDQDDALFEIYRSFATELNKIARSSDDPALNRTIMTALDHIAHALPPEPATNAQPFAATPSAQPNQQSGLQLSIRNPL